MGLEVLLHNIHLNQLQTGLDALHVPQFLIQAVTHETNSTDIEWKEKLGIKHEQSKQTHHKC